MFDVQYKLLSRRESINFWVQWLCQEQFFLCCIRITSSVTVVFDSVFFSTESTLWLKISSRNSYTVSQVLLNYSWYVVCRSLISLHRVRISFHWYIVFLNLNRWSIRNCYIQITPDHFLTTTDSSRQLTQDRCKQVYLLATPNGWYPILEIKKSMIMFVAYRTRMFHCFTICFSIKNTWYFDFTLTNFPILVHNHERKEDWSRQPRWVPTTLQTCCIV